jgi:hypothetical protein
MENKGVSFQLETAGLLLTQREIKELYCPVSSDESQIKEVSIDLFEHFDFSPEKLKTLQGNDKTLPYLINNLEFNEIPYPTKLRLKVKFFFV